MQCRHKNLTGSGPGIGLRAGTDLPGYHKRTQFTLGPIIVRWYITVICPAIWSLGFFAKYILYLLYGGMPGLAVSDLDYCRFDSCRLAFELFIRNFQSPNKST